MLKIGVYAEMVVSLLVLAAIGIAMAEARMQLLTQLLLAVVSATAAELLLRYYKQRRRVTLASVNSVKTGVISGLFVGMLLNAGSVWYLVVAIALLSILLKHALVLKHRQLFNTAALGLLVSGILFNEGPGWWGASSLAAIVVLGLAETYRIRGFSIVVPFLLFYLLASSLIIWPWSSLSKGINALVNMLEAPMIPFFALFMLIEPRTSPRTTRNKAAYGSTVGVMAPLFLKYLPGYSILGALLVGNLLVAALPWLKGIVRR